MSALLEMASPTLTQRFWAKVEKTDTCWLWTGAVGRRDGYGRIALGGRQAPIVLAHRVSYELLVGPVPEGLQVDHVHARGCRHRHCVHPAHLEPVTQGENIARGEAPSTVTHRTDTCKRGHDFTANAYVWPRTGKRQCRRCMVQLDAERRRAAR